MEEGTIGEIRLFAGTFAPRNWAYCNGVKLAIATHQTLFAVIGTTYGGDGRVDFAIPDLRGRVPMGAGNGLGLTPIRLGENAGHETNTLTVPNLPSHTHTATGTANGTIKASTDIGTTNDPTGNVLAKSIYQKDRATQIEIKTYAPAKNLVNMAATESENVAITVGLTGTNIPVNNIQPSTAINYIICMEGLFPTRP